eukprot:TRINITY_DN2454_c0_g1_i1.p1 TRINITY_DN2454_c0_g1~~TRINITY_DN2454_c0_g1_i1.p1  ORF type:complete len:696 (-),score=95.75 TRINITY_DN2454_c0_g1_i1:17-2083(-)
MADRSAQELQIAAFGSIPVYVNTLLDLLGEGARFSNEVPRGTEFEYLGTFKSFSREMSTGTDRLMKIVTKLASRPLKRKATRGGSTPFKWATDMDLIAVQEKLIDMIDSALESADFALDELAGKSSKSFGEEIEDEAGEQGDSGIVDRSRGRTILPPQRKFQPPPDNSLQPFRVKRYDPVTGQVRFGEPGVHYFKETIQTFTPLESTLCVGDCRVPAKLAQTPLGFISTVPALHQLFETLSRSEEIAVDLEAHTYRSYQGFTCVMQISTRTEDFVIDTLELREHMHILAPIFANPKVVKVFHGASHDIEWLQRDFGIFVVNLWDSFVAAELLHFPKLSLAYLLQLFCGVQADKKFQRADWRTRPLPAPMLAYARSDTHYLLHIYDCLKRQLYAKGHRALLETVVDRSRTVSLRLYSKERIDDEEFFRRHAPGLSEQQKAVASALLAWRDKVARTEDESTGYVLPNAMLVALAQKVPQKKSQLLSCLQPVPPLVASQVDHVVGIINAAAAPFASQFLFDTTPLPGHLSDTVQCDQASENPLSFTKDFNSELIAVPATAVALPYPAALHREPSPLFKVLAFEVVQPTVPQLLPADATLLPTKARRFRTPPPNETANPSVAETAPTFSEPTPAAIYSISDRYQEHKRAEKRRNPEAEPKTQKPKAPKGGFVAFDYEHAANPLVKRRRKDRE